MGWDFLVEELIHIMQFKSLCLAAALFAAALAAAPAKPVNTDSHGVAVQGYDVVAYFDQKQPVKGSPEFTFVHDGATYRFTTAEHRDLFAKDPERYLPQYGGYCAYGVSEGHKAPIDPTAWSVIDGKLYLNYNKSVQKTFSEGVMDRIHKADEIWPKLR